MLPHQVVVRVAETCVNQMRREDEGYRKGLWGQ